MHKHIPKKGKTMKIWGGKKELITPSITAQNYNNYNTTNQNFCNISKAILSRNLYHVIQK